MNFSWRARRFLRCLALDINQDHQAFFPAALVSLLFGLQVLLGGVTVHHNAAFLAGLAFILCALNTSHAFSDIHSSLKAPFVLLLPASNEEKFTSRLCLSLVIAPLAALLALTLLSVVHETIRTILTGATGTFSAFHPAVPEVRGWALSFPLLHAVFFTGSLFFRKSALLKTLLSIALYALVFFVIVVSLGRQVLWSLVQDLLIWNGEIQAQPNFLSSPQLQWIPLASAFLRTTLIPVMLYVAGWLRLREQEVS